MKNTVLFLVSFALLAVGAPAQDWAKARLEKSSRHQEWVKVENGKRKIESFVVYPEVKDKAPAVIVIHEIFGLSDWARLTADEFAEAGCIAIAPDLLSGMGPNGGGTAELGDKVGRTIQSLPPDQITADLNAVAAYVSKLPACNGKVIVTGYCWGGGQSFRYACNNKDLRAALVFYGTGPTDENLLKKIDCPVYGFYGGNDARVTATVDKSKELMRSAGKKYEPVIYEGAGHGFMRAGEDPGSKNEANKKARDEAWSRIKDLLKKI